MPSSDTMELTQEQWLEWRGELLRFVVARVPDAETAEDIVHDVIVRAYDRIGDLRYGEKLAAWLHRIARNAVIDYYRARRPAEPLPPDLADEQSDGGELRRRLSRCLVPLVASLPDGQREAVELSEIQGLTQQETADRLGLSLSGVKSRVQRGRARLRQMLDTCCRIETDGRGGIIAFERRPTSPYPACEGCTPS